jgi:hypothetical protein
LTTPWLTNNKGSATQTNKTGQGTTLGTDQFYEGGIDLTLNRLDTDPSGKPLCVNKFAFDTRSAQSLTATLYDYAEGNLQTCAAPKISTELFLKNAAPPDTSLAASPTVTLPATVYDTSTITGAISPAAGTVTYSLFSDSTCLTPATDPLFAGPSSSATVTLASDGTVPASPPLTFTSKNSYWWQAYYSGGGRNQGATSDCTSEPLSVVQPQPTIATTPSTSALTIGGTPAPTFTDTANITGGYFPTGGIAVGGVEFKLYGPFANAAAVSCSGTAVVDKTTAAARGTDTTAQATTDPYIPLAVGVYQWTAAYLESAPIGQGRRRGRVSQRYRVQARRRSLRTRTMVLAKAM